MNRAVGKKTVKVDKTPKSSENEEKKEAAKAPEQPVNARKLFGRVSRSPLDYDEQHVQRTDGSCTLVIDSTTLTLVATSLAQKESWPKTGGIWVGQGSEGMRFTYTNFSNGFFSGLTPYREGHGSQASSVRFPCEETIKDAPAPVIRLMSEAVTKPVIAKQQEFDLKSVTEIYERELDRFPRSNDLPPTPGLAGYGWSLGIRDDAAPIIFTPMNLCRLI